MKSVLISGASAAGPAIAYLLVKRGFQATLVERAPGLDSIGTWLLFNSTIVAPIRFAAARIGSGCTVRSSMASVDQPGFERQAMPPSGI